MKKIIATTAALLFAASVFAQEMGMDDFSMDMGFDDASMEADTGVKISGAAEFGGRMYVDQYDDQKALKDWEISLDPKAKLEVGYTGTSSDITAKLKFDKFSLGDYKEDILDEFTLRAYLGNFQLEAGKMRLVWGKGDKLHVLDNFNANDYTDFLTPDYLDRRIAEPMFRAVYATPNNVKFEAVYAPTMTPDRYGNGRWTPLEQRSLSSTIESNIKGATGPLALATTAKVEAGTKLSVMNSLKARYDVINTIVTETTGAGGTPTADQLAELSNATTALIGAINNPLITSKAALDATLPTVMSSLENNVKTAETNYLTALMAASSFSANSLYPNTRTFEYGQAGARLTFTAGPIDFGFSYYYGHNKQVSVDKKLLLGFNGDTSKITDGKLLSYDRLQVFGFESAFVIPGVGLNTRLEFAYNMTDDIKGDDPTIHNNSLAWVFGFDRDLPIHNININLQTQGKYVLNKDKIDDMGASKIFDVDYDQKNDDGEWHASNNKIVVMITDSWNYEKVKLELKGIYGIERKDLIVFPTLTFKLADSFNLDLSGMYIWSKDKYSEFDGWNRNSYAQIKCRMTF